MVVPRSARSSTWFGGRDGAAVRAVADKGPILAGGRHSPVDSGMGRAHGSHEPAARLERSVLEPQLDA